MPLLAPAGYHARRAVRRATSTLIGLSGRFTHDFYIALEYRPSSRNVPRYGYGRPEHAALAATLSRETARYESELARLGEYKDDLLRIARTRPANSLEPYWAQAWLPRLDAMALYGFVRSRSPSRYLEVGAGVSTMFVRRAIRDGGLSTRIISIDPAPRAQVGALCDSVIRVSLEDVDLAIFDELMAGDVVFVDGSHRSFMNSD